MNGTIEFRHDTINDIVIARPTWVLETPGDVIGWYAEYERQLKRFGRRMDYIIVLDDFDIAPAVASFWGEYRAKMVQRIMRHSCRVRASRRVQTFINTSGARFDAATDVAGTIQEATAVILALRADAARTAT
jgi:hypothetical protein